MNIYTDGFKVVQIKLDRSYPSESAVESTVLQCVCKQLVL
jgi:hypothetical protein